MRACVLGVLLAGLAVGTENPISFSLSGNRPAAGKTALLKLQARIEEGWHLYGMAQPENGPRPTTIGVGPQGSYQLAKPVRAPKPLRVHDDNFGLEVEYYEGAAAFEVPVKAASAAAGAVQVKVTYQACNDRLCLPPKTVTLEK